MNRDLLNGLTMTQQRIVHYQGNVQGVGFRYMACRAAGGFDVTGYVRNLADGRVEMVVEGESAQIDAFLEDVARQMSQHIRKCTQQTRAAMGTYRTFGIEF